MVASLDVDAPASKLLRRVLCQLLVKHGQYLLRHIVDGNLVVLDELRVNLGHVLVDQVVQLRTELDPRGPATHNGKVE